MNSGDLALVEKEKQRILGYYRYIEELGHDRSLYDIFWDATEAMFNGIITAVKEGATQDDNVLLGTFNNDYASSSIITYFRVSFPQTSMENEGCRSQTPSSS